MRFPYIKSIKEAALVALLGLYSIIPSSSCGPDIDESKKKSVFAQRQEKIFDAAQEENIYEVKEDTTSNLEQRKPQYILFSEDQKEEHKKRLEELAQLQESEKPKEQLKFIPPNLPESDSKASNEPERNLLNNNTENSKTSSETLITHYQKNTNVEKKNQIPIDMRAPHHLYYQRVSTKVSNKLSAENPTPSDLALKALRDSGITKLIGSENIRNVLYGDDNSYEGFLWLNLRENLNRNTDVRNATNLPVGREFTWDFRLLPFKYQELLNPSKFLEHRVYDVLPIEEGGIENGTLGGLIYKYLKEYNIPLENDEVYNGLAELVGNKNIELRNIQSIKLIYPGQKVEFFPDDIAEYIKKLTGRQTDSSYNFDSERGWSIQRGDYVFKQDKSSRWRVKNKGANAPGVFASKSELLEAGLI